MQIQALLFDFKVLAPIDIDYQKAMGILTKEYISVFDPGSTDIFRQLALVKEKSTKESYGALSKKMTGLLDEIEYDQINQFPLHMGVKNGLASLKETKLHLAAITELGSNAADRFLEEKEISQYIEQSFTRSSLDDSQDFGSRLKLAFEKLQVKPEECIYFCNTIADLKRAREFKLRTIVLPSKKDPMNRLMMEKPDGLIITLEEIPNMLEIDTFKAQSEQEQQPDRAEEALPQETM